MPVPESRENPDSRRAARMVRDGAVGRASESAPALLTRRALREAREAAARRDSADVAPLAPTLTLPVVVAENPPILRPAAPPASTVQGPSNEPLLPASPARHRVPVRHARRARAFRVGGAARVGASLALAVAGMFVVGSAAAVTAAVAPVPEAVVAEAPAPKVLAEVRLEAPTVPLGPTPQTVQIPPADASSSGFGAQAFVAPCDTPALTSALTVGDDAATIAAAGGSLPFREMVASGSAPCVALNDPARSWVVVDKSRPLAPVDYRPATLAVPAGVVVLDGGELRQDASGAMSAMADAARVAGAGEIGVGSAFRSYETQVATYDSHVARRGTDGADLVSARPGYSEHQTGLAADVVPCGETCGTIDDLAASAQGAWIAEHAWEYGWIVRYPDGGTDVTGYLPEPWHLRYIGVDLAREYHDGGWHTLEEFFGLPAAPHYDH